AIVGPIDHHECPVRRHRQRRTTPRLGQQRLLAHEGAELLGPVVARDAAGHGAQPYAVASGQDHPPVSAHDRFPSCWRSLATRAVQPVWWLAPTPAPVSPSKYSWNGIRSRQCESAWNFSTAPSTGRR